jgi:hypothetical protein
MAFDREQIKSKVATLAASGVYTGTSNWKYEGWRDALRRIALRLAWQTRMRGRGLL